MMSEIFEAWTPYQVRGDGIFDGEFIPQVGNFGQRLMSPQLPGG